MSEATVTLPVSLVVQTTLLFQQNIRISRCRLCNERFSHHGDDPADLIAEIVTRNHVVPIHGGELHGSKTDGSDFYAAPDRGGITSTGRPDVHAERGCHDE